MKPCVDFHTAIPLKESGLRPPTLDSGQFWYTEAGRITFIDEDGEDFFIYSGENGLNVRTPKSSPLSTERIYFAPTAIDIINQMPGLEITKVGDTFICTLRTNEGIKIFRDKHPAEACAKAWLELHPIL